MENKVKNVFSLVVPKNVQICWGVDFIKVTGPLGILIKKKENFNCLLNDSIFYLMCEDNKGPFYLLSIRYLILGVLKGYSIKLRLVGVGFKAMIKDKKLFLKIGFSHESIYQIPEDVEISCSKMKGTLILIKGKEEQRVRQVATEIRSIRFPDVYKGKGIHLDKEILKLKKGKREGR